MKGLVKRAHRRKGLLATTSTPGRITTGVILETGVVCNERVVRQRVEWLQTIVSELAQTSLTQFWNQPSFDTVAKPDQPSYAAKMMEQRLTLPKPPTGVHVSSRVQRIAGELAGRELRKSQHQATIIRELLEHRAGHVEWGDVAGTMVEKRNLSRLLNKFEAQHGRPASGFFDTHPLPPQLAPTVPLSTVDKQFVEWVTGVDGRLQLKILLPTKPKPARLDWEWMVLSVSVNPRVFASILADRVFHTLPTLRVRRGKIHADITLDTPTPKRVLDPNKAFGLDWGLGRLLSGAVVSRVGDEYHTTGRLYAFDARGYHSLDHKRRVIAEQARAKIDRITPLLDETNPNPKLVAKIQQLAAVATNASGARYRANRELARLAARWAVEQALSLGCGVIAIENLDSLEPAFDKKRRINLSQRLRGLLRTALKTACLNAGLTYIEVNPAHTSKICHGCKSFLSFQKAPDNPTRGWHWAWCAACGRGWDRDLNAAINIATRALRSPDSGVVRSKRGYEAGAFHDLGGVTRVRGKRPRFAPSPRSSRVHSPNSRAGSPVRARRRLHRAVTPPRPGARVSVTSVNYRSAGLPGKEPPSLGVDRREVSNSNTNIRIRMLDGLRYAHRHRLRATPVRVPQRRF